MNSTSHGARPLRRTIQKEILDPLSIGILEGKVREGQDLPAAAGRSHRRQERRFGVQRKIILEV